MRSISNEGSSIGFVWLGSLRFNDIFNLTFLVRFHNLLIYYKLLNAHIHYLTFIKLLFHVEDKTRLIMVQLLQFKNIVCV